MSASDAAAGTLVTAGLLGPVLLGILQGLTEFLPVSSSGHLVLFQQFFEIGDDHVLFDLVLHVGTLIPILWVYRTTLWMMLRDPLVGEGPVANRPGTRLLGLLILATIPTALIGLLLQDVFEALFSTPAVLVVTFAITGALLFSTRKLAQGRVRVGELTWRQALILGVAQGFAITPGISRSGTTISVAMFLGLEREFAARFSFLMSVPAILGAVVLKLRDVEHAGIAVDHLLVGGIAAMVSGYFALVVLVRVVKQGRFASFAYYCWFAALVAGVIAIVRAV